MAPPRSSRSKTSAPSAPVEEETFNLDVSDSSGDDSVPNPAAKAKNQVTPGANIGNETTRVAPITKPVVKSNRALDIDLLFNRGKGTPSVCKYCK
jgi:hypothetical protein